ncbi:Glycine zipper 2TM domain-containing protein [Acetobacteraceae bacterium EV16G]|uniref:Glycine zipper 2TM domain-containing protein n=1 Tax=Sorlinia euscelidii TaxID=3081148 RepID=A0ABU7U2J3_9PROT
MSSKILRHSSAIAALTLMASCAAPGTENRADTYGSAQVNQRQALKVVTIIGVAPARVQVNNSRNQTAAQIAGGILGAGLGVGLGLGVGHSNAGAALGGLGGGVAGAAAGSIVPDTTFVNGVQIAYKDGNAMYSSAQVGRLCEFAPGQAMLVAMTRTETRVQPNHQCPRTGK